MPAEAETAATKEAVPEPTYEPPQIIWEEVFPTTVFGVSCAKHPGQPRCSAGPLFR
jgi:hypothetical protein